MPRNLVLFLFSFKGRISRQPYWVFTLTMVAILDVPAFFLGFGTEAADTYLVMLGLVFLWPILAVQTKRWHDRDKSAWWLLINLIPPIGFVWSLIENGLLQGTPGINRFGPNPLEVK